MATLAQNKIRIRLKSYDHSAIETAAKRDRRDGDSHRRDRVRARPASDREERLLRDPLAVQGQGLARALRDPHAQAADRHPPADAEDRRLAPAARPPARRRRHRDPARKLHGRDPRQEARDDPALPRRRPRRARHRARGRAVPGHRHPHARARRLRGRAARVRRLPREAADEGRARPPEEGRRLRAPPPRRVPRRGRRAAGRRDRHRRGVRGRSEGQDLRDLQGQGLPGHDQAPQIPRRPEVARLAQRARAGLDRRLRLAGARDEGHPRPGSDGQQARHAEGPRDRRGRCRERTCCSSAAPCPARRAARWRCAPMPDAPKLAAAPSRSTTPPSAPSSTARSCTRPCARS